MQALIDFILSRLMLLWPFALVRPWQLGLRVRFGKAIEELEPGLHWRWPFNIDEVYVTTVTEDVLDLQYGDIPTKDGQLVTFSANVAFEIKSVWKLWRSVSDLTDNLPALAIGKLAELISTCTYAELADDQGEVRAWLKKELAHECSAWGVKITRVFLTSLVLTKPVRLIADGGLVSVG